MLPSEKQQELVKLVQKDFLGKVLIPVYPEFLPWAPVKSKRRVAWRKIGNILEKERRRFEGKTPVLILEILSETELEKIVPLRGYIQELETGARQELWLKCLWVDEIVFHRINHLNYNILKQLLMEEEE